jgi:hypothetical protein
VPGTGAWCVLTSSGAGLDLTEAEAGVVSSGCSLGTGLITGSAVNVRTNFPMFISRTSVVRECAFDLRSASPRTLELTYNPHR